MRSKNYPKLFLLASLAVVTIILSLPACKTAPPPAPPPPVVTVPPVIEVEPGAPRVADRS